jgi:hypothetical protein
MAANLAAVAGTTGDLGCGLRRVAVRALPRCLAHPFSGKGLDLIGQRSQTSTRRFFSRPSSVSFEAIGMTLPNPLTTDGLMPRICN